MTKYLHLSLLVVLALSFQCVAYGQTSVRLTGIVRSEQGEPLPFATVLVKDIKGKGTITNQDGEYLLVLPSGQHTLEAKCIGYLSATQVVQVGDKTLSAIDWKLKPSVKSTSEVTISSVDPAVAIMRKAIKKRTFYDKSLPRFEVKTYMKGFGRVRKFPKRILGKKVELDKEDTINKGVFYLSESASTFHYDKKEGVKEIMTASKVSGEPRGFSFNNYLGMRQNLYATRIKVPAAKRGVISPLHPNAFVYYRFRLEDSYQEDGLTIHKIKLTPRRKIDPAFSGYIYIQEGSWRMHAADFVADRNAGLEIMDTVVLRQTFMPLNDSVWMPASEEVSGSFSLLGIGGEMRFATSLSDYNLQPTWPKRFFKDRILLQVDSSANKKSDAFFDSIRAVPLTELEVRDYKVNDSLHAAHQTKAYKDSVYRAELKDYSLLGELKDYWNGGIRLPYDSLRKSVTIGKGLISDLDFLPVTGLRISLPIALQGGQLDGLTLTPSYATVANRFYFTSGYRWGKSGLNATRWSVSGGSTISQVNGANPISTTVAMGLALLAQRNLGRFMQEEFATLQAKRRLGLGWYGGAKLHYGQRSPLAVVSQYSLRGRADYAPNLPEIGNKEFERQALTATNALSLELNLSWQPGRYLYQLGGNTIETSSSYPTFWTIYKTGQPIGSLSTVNYNRIEFGMEYERTLGLLGKAEAMLKSGRFLTHQQVYLPDAQHFTGQWLNPIHSGKIDNFFVLDYYTYSTQNSWTQLHLRYNFQRFLTNKLPLIRKWKLEELVQFNALWVGGRQPYYEAAIGVTNIFKILSIQYGMQLSAPHPNRGQWLVGIRREISM